MIALKVVLGVSAIGTIGLGGTYLVKELIFKNNLEHTKEETDIKTPDNLQNPKR